MRNAKGMVNRYNLRLFLEIVEACIKRGKHKMTDKDLKELLLDLCTASLDWGVCGSCSRGVPATAEATVNAMSHEFLEDNEAFSSLVDDICTLKGRGVPSPLPPSSMALLARGVPIGRRAGGLGSLRGEVCHRMLSQRLLKETSYPSKSSKPGFHRTLAALAVMEEGDGGVMAEDSDAFEVQYSVVALADTMGAASLLETGRNAPLVKDCKELWRLSESIQRRLRQTLQPFVQSAKGLLTMIGTKYKTAASSTSARQTSLLRPPSLGSTHGADEAGDEDSEDEGEYGGSEDRRRDQAGE
ncbi:unnamed protein product, partial [Discosporangium mesarthrocarpum]